MKEKSRHSRGSGNPVLILFNIQTSWMPAFAGMTNTTPSPEAEGQGGGGGNCSSGRCADSVSPASDGVLSLPPSSVSRPQISRNQGSPADKDCRGPEMEIPQGVEWEKSERNPYG